jgi:hypothetical protein
VETGACVGCVVAAFVACVKSVFGLQMVFVWRFLSGCSVLL